MDTADCGVSKQKKYSLAGDSRTRRRTRQVENGEAHFTGTVREDYSTRIGTGIRD
jgi:hypothetical protein